MKVAAGSTTKHTVPITNNSKSFIVVERFSSSCDCLYVALPRDGMRIEPDATAKLELTLDLSGDPKNTNDFAPEVVLSGDGLEEPFAFTLDIEVQK